MDRKVNFYRIYEKRRATAVVKYVRTSIKGVSLSSNTKRRNLGI